MIESQPNPKRWKILAITVCMAFMSSLDSSIVNIALPGLSNSMGVPISTITWVVTAYMISVCVLMLFFGRLGDIKGNTAVFKFGIVIFAIGSLLCGISMNFTMLVVSRVIQGIGSAAALSNNQGIITRAFPSNERGRALGVNVTSVALGTMLGPPLGGLIVSVLSWHYIFLINIPIGIAVFLIGMRILPKGKGLAESLDIKGAVLFALSAILIFSAIGGGEHVEFSNPLVITALVAGVIMLTAFILVERKQSQPMLDLSIFKNSVFSISIICAFLVYIAMVSINIIQTFYLQNARGMSSFNAGMLLVIYPAFLAIASPLSGYLSDKIGPKFPTLIGLILSMIGYIGAAFMTISTSLVLNGVVYAFLGMGSALFQSPNTSLIMSSVPQSKVGVAGSINAFVRTTGMVFGVLISTTVLFAAMSAHYGQPVNDYIQGRPDVYIYGMRAAYLTISGVCFIGVSLTAFRLFRKEKPKQSAQ